MRTHSCAASKSGASAPFTVTERSVRLSGCRSRTSNVCGRRSLRNSTLAVMLPRAAALSIWRVTGPKYVGARSTVMRYPSASQARGTAWPMNRVPSSASSFNSRLRYSSNQAPSVLGGM